MKNHASGDPPAKDMGRRIAAGMAWTVGFRLIDRMLGLISTVVLARLLLPADFGLVGMATAVLAMIEVFRGLGFEAALIRNSEATRTDFDTAWTLNVLLGLLCALAMIAAAAPAARFFNEPQVQYLIYVLAAVPVLNGLTNVGIVEFRKNLDFKQDFELQFARRMLAVIITVSLAFSLRNYWALPIGMVIGWTIGLVLSYLWHPYRPRFSLASRSGILGFSGWIFLNNLLMFLRLKGASFVVGRYAGAPALGVFEAAYDISNLPTSALVVPINRALFPGYVQLRSNPDTLRHGVLQVIAGVALLAVAAGIGIACLAEPIVIAAMGLRWADAIEPIQLLALFGVTIALQVNLQSVYNALGKPVLQVWISVLTVAILLPLLVYLVKSDGVVGAARAYVIVGVLTLPINYFICFRLIGLRWRDVLKVLWRPVASAALMATVLVLTMQALPSSSNGSIQSLLNLLLLIPLGAVVYIGSVAALWLAAGRPEGAEAFFLRRARQALARKAKSDTNS